MIQGDRRIADVINSVNFARENGLLISVRGGGHNFPGNSVCEDGLMIDLSLRRGPGVGAGSPGVPELPQIPIYERSGR
ncbi:MAG: FAD-dependent oxidoreductase [Chloroflexi bacterium]|nr:FAD-dependent oxidoreductase [Chloroflexota bacterium]